jgi:hypothetical protein
VRRFDNQTELSGGDNYLLGLVHGHYGSRGLDSVDETLTDDATTRSINMGIAMVIPAKHIADVLYQERFSRVRNAYVTEMGLSAGSEAP